MVPDKPLNNVFLKDMKIMCLTLALKQEECFETHTYIIRVIVSTITRNSIFMYLAVVANLNDKWCFKILHTVLYVIASGIRPLCFILRNNFILLSNLPFLTRHLRTELHMKTLFFVDSSEMLLYISNAFAGFRLVPVNFI